ncbi:hypothetical protein LINGRAHAP2_LOCUS29168 [Linum grandiflorum]
MVGRFHTDRMFPLEANGLLPLPVQIEDAQAVRCNTPILVSQGTRPVGSGATTVVYVMTLAVVDTTTVGSFWSRSEQETTFDRLETSKQGWDGCKKRFPSFDLRRSGIRS